MRNLTTVLAGLVVTVVLVAPATAQDKIGVDVCDQVLTKVAACIGKMPSAEQAQFKGGLDQLREMWEDLAGKPNGKSALEGVCTQMGEGLKASMPQLGCAP